MTASQSRGMSLQVLLAPWVAVDDNRQVTGIKLDSRELSAGDVFLAVAGETTHGLDYLADALRLKISAVIVSANDEKIAGIDQSLLGAASVPLIEVANLPAHAGEVISRFYGDPSHDLKVIGVTGTDGKTSLCHLLGQALNENRDNCGIIGTLGWGFNGQLKDAGLTTPDAVTLQKALAEFKENDASYVAMEVSSHALSQSRVAGIVFDVAVLTNLGRDHLDYHGTMENYRTAKESLFYHPQLRAAVVNIDDEFGNSLVGRLTDLDLTTYGSADGDGQHVRYDNIVQSTDGLQFEISFAGQGYKISSPLLGGFNVSNLTAIFAILVSLGLSPDLAARSLTMLAPVPGRMESTRLRNGATIIVDYAHNPHALESVLKNAADHVEGKLTVVFGCGGDRDQGKRPLMAGIAERYANHCIVTDDNPRGEDGDAIVSQIVAGFERAADVVVERDRRTAIRKALSAAAAGDMVVIAGKGHEDYQLVGDQKLPFSDSEVVAEFALELAS